MPSITDMAIIGYIAAILWRVKMTIASARESKDCPECLAGLAAIEEIAKENGDWHEED